VDERLKELIARLVAALYQEGFIGVYPHVPLLVLRKYFSEEEIEALLSYLRKLGLVEEVKPGEYILKLKIVTPNVLFFEELPRHPEVEIEASKPFTTHDVDIVLSKLTEDVVEYLRELYEEVCRRGLLGLHICTKTNTGYRCVFAYCPESIRDKTLQADFDRAIEKFKRLLEELSKSR